MLDIVDLYFANSGTRKGKTSCIFLSTNHVQITTILYTFSPAFFIVICKGFLTKVNNFSLMVTGHKNDRQESPFINI